AQDRETRTRRERLPDPVPLHLAGTAPARAGAMIGRAMPGAMPTYDGSCHCGRVKFRVTADLARIVRCNCSICTKKGFLHLIVPPARFELLSGADDLTE